MFTLVIPVFNEQDNLVSLIKEIKTALANYINFELYVFRLLIISWIKIPTFSSSLNTGMTKEKFIRF